MRVIHILDHSIPLATPYAARTIAMLEQQRALGWETFHLTGPHHDSGTETEEQVGGWHFYRTPRPGGILEGVPGLGAIELMGEIAYRIERIARRVRPHILHAHAPVANAIPALRVGRRLRIPVVYEARPAIEMAGLRGDTSGASLGRRCARMAETWVLKRVDAITTISEATREDIVRRGIAAAKVTVIPSGMDFELALSKGARPQDNKTDTRRPVPGAGYRDVYAHLMGAA